MDYKKFGKTGLNKRKVVIWIRNVFLVTHGVCPPVILGEEGVNINQ